MQLGFRPSKEGLTLTALTLLQIFGLYIFLKGFLLTRQTFDLQGKHFEPWQDFPLTQHTTPVKTPPTIPSQTAFKRITIVVVDALRFDFAIHAEQQSYYRNQFPVLQKLTQEQPASSLLYQFRADPPTTTMQRIKALMTGSLPTFIDAGSNFASSAVNEDHLLRHLVANKTVYFLGDDTWVHLFPESFSVKERTFDSDSFKMLDLDSVDDAILARLWGVLDNDEEQVTIAHFLGVDHCGHTYGPSDPNMKRKLNQMNDIVERLVSEHVDPDTLLVVMGDHGMSVEGDHGGESVEELISTLFMHSGRPLTLAQDDYYSSLYHRIHQARAQRLDYDMTSISQRLDYDATLYPVVAQIHLVPSLAYLMHVPIPFGNLGALLPETLMPQHPTLQAKTRNVLHMVQAFRTNALQVKHYLDQYAQHTHQLDFSPEKVQSMTRHLYAAEDIMVQLVQTPGFLDGEHADDDYLEQLEDAILAYDAFLISTIKYCKAIWAQFDTGCMCVGIVLLGLSTLASVWLMHHCREPSASYYSRLSLVGGGASVFVACLRYQFLEAWLARGWFEKMGHVDWIGVCMAIAVCCMILAQRPQQAVSSYDCYIILVAHTVQACTLGSNSFVIWEDRVTRHVLVTLTLVWMARNLQAASTSTRTDRALAVLYPTLFLVIVRLVSAIGQCREEQFPHCNYFHSGMLEFNLENYVGYSTIAFVILLYGMVIFSTTTLNQVSGLTIGGCYLVSCIMVLFRIFYEIGAKSLAAADQSQQTAMPLMVHHVLDVYMPRIVYALTFIGNNMTLADWYFNSRPRRVMSWALFFLWTPLLAVVQRPLGAALILASPWIVKLLTTGTSNSLLIRLTMLHFLGHHLFFATGHQATFTSLPWKAAFVGFDEMNYYGGMVLVTLATVAGYIVTWFGWLVLLSENPAAAQGQALHLMILLQSIPTFLSAIFIYVLKRHLMTWKIFAPRFLFQVLLQVSSHVAAIVLEKIVVD